jgi:hypothetical protein
MPHGQIRTSPTCVSRGVARHDFAARVNRPLLCNDKNCLQIEWCVFSTNAQAYFLSAACGPCCTLQPTFTFIHCGPCCTLHKTKNWEVWRRHFKYIHRHSSNSWILEALFDDEDSLRLMSRPMLRIRLGLSLRPRLGLKLRQKLGLRSRMRLSLGRGWDWGRG